MQCDNCSFRFNSTTRKPLYLPCGDTICMACASKVTKCCACYNVLNPEMSYPINKGLQKIIEQKNKDEIDMIIKICLIGSTTVGKSSLIRQLVGEPFTQHMQPTVGIDFKYCDRQVNDLKFRYQLWDTAGQQRFQSISKTYYKNTDFVIIAYDMSSSVSQNKVSFWIEQALTHSSKDVRIIIVGNKKDLIKLNKVYRPIDGNTWQIIEQQKYTSLEVSCKTNFGLENMWKVIDQKTITKVKKLKPGQNIKIQGTKISSPQQKQSSERCRC